MNKKGSDGFILFPFVFETLIPKDDEDDIHKKANIKFT